MGGPVYQPKGRAAEYAEYALNHVIGCDHGCKYCSACLTLKKARQEFYESPYVVKDVLERLEKQCQTGELNGKTVHMCFVSDPYCKVAVESGVTRKAMEIFNRYGINFSILTKGGTRAVADFDLYKPGDSFGTTLTLILQNELSQWEPGATSYGDRVNAIIEAHRRGIKTWVSLEPVLNPVVAKMIVLLMRKYVDLWKVGKWNYDARAKAINWRKFGHEIETIFKEFGCEYYIKEDLRREMEC